MTRRYTGGKRDLRLTRSPRADEVRRRLQERDALAAADDRTLSEKLMGDPGRARSALSNPARGAANAGQIVQVGGAPSPVEASLGQLSHIEGICQNRQKLNQ
jgi:hypothetical protein